jgi:hypothetical protein
MTTSRANHPAWLYVLLPATAMLLGWGLRGYIGGGTWGAMIPGVFVALSICLLLGYKMETAVIAAVFGAMGVGQGGTETYGQTLGLIRELDRFKEIQGWDTRAWGVLGCIVKGGVWGLLGGAVLGLGLDRTQYKRSTVIAALLITIPVFIIAVNFINEPKYPWLYFSHPVGTPEDPPRGESWAGLLFAPIALLAVLRALGPKEAFAIPLQFSLWGALGGAIGFGGGCLWLAFGPNSWQWVGWWKMMEFSFGFAFGAALGWCAWLNREHLERAGQEGDAPVPSWPVFLAFLAYLVFITLGGRWLYGALPDGFRDDHIVLAETLSALFIFMSIGAVTCIFGMYSRHAALQAAITLTVYHTVLDYTRDLGTPDAFGYTLAESWQQIIPLLCAAVIGVLVYYFMNRPRPVQNLLLLAVWACYLSGCARSFLHKGLFFPEDGVGRFEAMFGHHASLILVHGIFTASAMLTTWFVIKYFKNEKFARIAN